MALKFFGIKRVLQTSLFGLVVLPLGCGEDPTMYHDETLSFESPISSSSKHISGDKEMTELDLGENEHSDFHVARWGGFGYVPWGPYPVFDYYLEPVPFEVPVSPVFSLIDYVHPFYAVAALNPWWDDDDGLHFRPDDD